MNNHAVTLIERIPPRVGVSAALGGILFLLLMIFPGHSGASEVLVLTYSGVINPVAAEFIGKNITGAEGKNYEAIVLELDTPGGLDTSMREIIKSIIASEVPVAVYVSPGGARAASAGAYITISAHIAAMDPQTNIGAAHPVAVGGGMDDTMKEKVENDSAAYIISLAEKRGRNSKWAEKAVRKSISASAEEALRENVIDVIASSTAELLKKIDGWEVETLTGKKVLKTEGAEVTRREMGFRLKVLSVVSDPTVAYLLLMLGFYGIFFELIKPGVILPGLLGAFFLILGLYGMNTLPVNYAGLLLIIFGIALFVLEIKITSYGALTLGAIASMTIGSLMLFDSPDPVMRVSLSVVIPMVGASALFFGVIVWLAIGTLRNKPVTGVEGLVGLQATVLRDIEPDNGGMVLLRGEYWKAEAQERIEKGSPVTVESVEGLSVKVKRTGQ